MRSSICAMKRELDHWKIGTGLWTLNWIINCERDYGHSAFLSYFSIEITLERSMLDRNWDENGEGFFANALACKITRLSSRGGLQAVHNGHSFITLLVTKENERIRMGWTRRSKQ